MALYRVYMIGSDRHIKDVETVTCTTDQEACVEAERMLELYKTAEVWDGSRLVARVSLPPHRVG
jgi:hypothetical protein